MHFDDRGLGIPIIFIHPPGMGRKVFFYQFLLSKNFRVILPDLSGHGDTRGCQDHVSIVGFAEEIKLLMDELQLEKAVLCGYSSGGAVAQEFCLNYPNKVIAVILAGGFAQVQSLTLKYEHLIGMYMVKHCPKLLAKIIAGSHTDFPPLKNELTNHMLKADHNVWFQFYSQSLHYTCLERLNNWCRPLLLINGTKDIHNQHIKSYQKRVHVQLAFIKKATHQLPVRHWKHFNQIITEFAETFSV